MSSRHLTTLWLLSLILVVTPVTWADDEFPDNDTILHALVDELERSMKMQLEDLEKPYLIQFAVEDAVRHQMSANYGAIVSSSRSQSRTFQSRVRVGSYELDNTNFSGGGFRRGRGGRAQLPIDDDYIALRKAIWLATDRDYKSAVETLTQKRAYMKDKNLEDRPDDYSKVEPTRWFEPEATLEVDQEQWKEYLRQVSGRFMKHVHIQNSSANLSTIASNKYVVTSEGTRLRHARIQVLLRLSAQVQTDDGERFSDVREFIVESPGDLPTLTEGLAAVDDLSEGLHRAMQSAVLDEYTGPVLFDGLASAQMFQSLMAAGVAGRPESVGSGRRRFGGARSLDRFIGRRILPASFQVYDDPRETTFDDQSLYGHYRFDDEGVRAQRVDIVVDGKLVGMAMSRVPTKKLSGTNGHARSGAGGGLPRAAIGCLHIEANDGLSPDRLKAVLIGAAMEQGLDYALRVTSLGGAQQGTAATFQSFRRGGGGRGGNLGDPIHIYKVYVEDGREEPVRGCEFGAINVRTLQRIIGCGDSPTVYNYRASGATPPASIIAPAVVFEELDLASIDQENEKKPILPAPHLRKKAEQK